MQQRTFPLVLFQFFLCLLCLSHTASGSHLHLSNVVFHSKHGHKHEGPPKESSNDVLPTSSTFNTSSHPSPSPLKLAKGILKRLPFALKQTAIESTRSFVTTFPRIVPIGLILNSNKLPHYKAWIKAGAATGYEWSKMSAVYVGGETFTKFLRGKEDRYNSYIGSGLSSAILARHEGPFKMIQSFAMGYSFMYVIDSIIGRSPVSLMTIPSIDMSHGHLENSAASALYGKRQTSLLSNPKLPSLSSLFSTKSNPATEEVHHK